MIERFRRVRHDERGAVIVIVALCLVAFLGLAAFVIDIGSWYQTERQAQSAADAAALAGAADLPGSASTAVTDAETYAAKNTSGWNLPDATTCTSGTQQVCVTTPYKGNSSEIGVSVTRSDSSFFGSLLGVTSAKITKTAAAKAGSVAVAGPIFAGSTSCSAITFTGLNGGVQMGGLVTNGAVGPNGFQGSNSATISSDDYNESSCGSPPYTPSGVTIDSTTSNSGTLPYPIDYRQQSQTINCTGNDATVKESGQASPSSDTSSNDTYTYSQSSLTFSGTQAVSGIYCAQTITLNNSAVLNGTATFIANTITSGVSDTGTLTPALGSLLIWQTGTSQMQINSTTFINGSVIFAPYAQIYLNSNALTGGAQTTLLEGNTVELTSMNGGSLGVASGLTGANSTAELVQ